MLVWVIAVAVSVTATAYFFHKGLIVAYGDAESHLNIAKRITNSITPGFGQLGGNWLPLHHMLMVPLVWNDYLWRTGLAGSVISMLSFIFSTVLIYKIVKLATANQIACWLAVALFVLNPGILYMQSTPMGELPLIAFLLASTYYFTKWALNKAVSDLAISAFFTFCGTLVRYDAWFLVTIQVFTLLLIGLHYRMSRQKIEGLSIIFMTTAALGMVLWVVWNYLIFNQPLYFLSSPYSAKAQQLSFLARGQLPSYHSLSKSLIFYSVASFKNIGLTTSILAVLGAVVYIISAIKKSRERPTFAAISILLSPYFFYVITLVLGISIILVPSLLPASYQFNLFNVRYGLMMVPAAVIFAAVGYAHFPKKFRFIMIGFALLQVTDTFKQPITLVDATVGLSARRPSPANNFVATRYAGGFVLFDDFARSANPIDLRVPMDKIIYVGNHPYWEDALQDPAQSHIAWVVMRQEDTDAVWEALKGNEKFFKEYQPIFNNGKTYVYKKN